jgi:hypothetical protein
VLESTEFESPINYNSIIDYIVALMKKFQSVKALYFDAAVPIVWQNCKKVLNERLDYEQHCKELQQWGYSQTQIQQKIRVHPVSFGASNHKAMLANLKWILDSNLLQIHPKFDRLITSLKTAQAEEFDLLKDQTSYADSLDSLRLACRFIVPLQKVGQGGRPLTVTAQQQEERGTVNNT